MNRMLNRNNIVALIICVCLLGCTGCQGNFSAKEEEPVDFTVLALEEYPERIQQEIEARKQSEFQIFYADQGYLYVAVGYGVQQSTCYSIAVNYVTHKEEEIYIKTVLKGPAKTDTPIETESFPVIVLKLKDYGGMVHFEL